MSLGITLTMVSGILIAAHFLRAGTYPLVLIGLAFPFLLFFRKPWLNRVVQILLILATAEWVYTLLLLIAQRQLTGQPWTRMAIILGAVALLNLVSALAVNPRKLVRQGAEDGKSIE
ncbi:MAG: hypothetical protein ACOY94_12310 [Bacillota bacterium]